MGNYRSFVENLPIVENVPQFLVNVYRSKGEKLLDKALRTQ